MCGSMVDIQYPAAEIRRGIKKLEVCANAQRDGRPAEQVAPSVQHRKVWLTPTTRCRAVLRLPRREIS